MPNPLTKPPPATTRTTKERKAPLAARRRMFSCRLPDDVLGLLHQIADDTGLPRTTVVANAIRFAANSKEMKKFHDALKAMKALGVPV